MRSGSPHPRRFTTISLNSGDFRVIVTHIMSNTVRVVNHLGRQIRLTSNLKPSGVLDRRTVAHNLGYLSLFTRQLRKFSPTDIYVINARALHRTLGTASFLGHTRGIVPCPVRVVSNGRRTHLVFVNIRRARPRGNHGLIVSVNNKSARLIVNRGFRPVLIRDHQVNYIDFTRLCFPNKIVGGRGFRHTHVTTTRGLRALA